MRASVRPMNSSCCYFSDQDLWKLSKIGRFGSPDKWKTNAHTGMILSPCGLVLFSPHPIVPWTLSRHAPTRVLSGEGFSSSFYPKMHFQKGFVYMWLVCTHKRAGTTEYMQISSHSFVVRGTEVWKPRWRPTPDRIPLSNSGSLRWTFSHLSILQWKSTESNQHHFGAYNKTHCVITIDLRVNVTHLVCSRLNALLTWMFLWQIQTFLFWKIDPYFPCCSRSRPCFDWTPEKRSSICCLLTIQNLRRLQVFAMNSKRVFSAGVPFPWPKANETAWQTEGTLSSFLMCETTRPVNALTELFNRPIRRKFLQEARDKSKLHQNHKMNISRMLVVDSNASPLKFLWSICQTQRVAWKGTIFSSWQSSLQVLLRNLVCLVSWFRFEKLHRRLPPVELRVVSYAGCVHRKCLQFSAISARVHSRCRAKIFAHWPRKTDTCTGESRLIRTNNTKWKNFNIYKRRMSN